MLLEAKDICFSYSNTKYKKAAKQGLLIDHVNLTIDRGERVALIGASGCGKSTLSKILSGYLKPDCGEVLLDGKTLPDRGYCPIQLIHQHPEKAINPRWRLGKTLNEGWNPDKTFINELGIKPEWCERYPAELSGGELQRFCIARAMSPLTKVLIADEITTMLDVITQAQIWELLIKITQERNMGLLVVTHNVELAKRVCSRIIEM